jgi:hypothetical protein
VQQLLAVIPFVQCLGLVQSLVALQADQPPAGRGRQRLGEFGLPGAGWALDEHRLAQPLTEVDHIRDCRVGEIADLLEQSGDLIGAAELSDQLLGVMLDQCAASVGAPRPAGSFGRY